MEALTWTFARGEERLTIVRDSGTGPSDVRLVISTNGAARSVEFTELAALVRYQSDMEASLIKSGWAFLKFSPERRLGGIRRDLPLPDERRRWWTDGMPTLTQVIDWDAERLPAEPKRDPEGDPT